MINLINIDCMKWLKRCEDNQYDLAIVDPPYGINATKMKMGGRKRGKEDFKKDWDTDVPSKAYFNEIFRVSKNQVIWGGNYFSLEPSRYFAIWDKGETMYGRDFAECEFAWVRKGGTRIFKFNPNQKDRIHPTQKPVMLYKWLLQNYAREGDKILDTHAGSASIAIACHDMGFYLDACEIDKEYFDAAQKRLDDHQRQLCLF